MIPDDVEKVIMTKEDYDRNVEQLLLEKINAEQEAEQLNYIITELKRWLEMHIESYKFYGDYEKSDAYDMLLYKLKELTEEKEKTIVEGNTMVNINGKNFHCHCGSNVFTQYSDYTFECHGCGAMYEGVEKNERI